MIGSVARSAASAVRAGPEDEGQDNDDQACKRPPVRERLGRRHHRDLGAVEPHELPDCLSGLYALHFSISFDFCRLAGGRNGYLTVTVPVIVGCTSHRNM
jgi:hypothetical protein